jgi:tetratricopeptide (TPR) repeat protein
MRREIENTMAEVNGEVSCALHMMGTLFLYRGNLGKAEKMYQRALEGYEKAWGPDHTSTLNTVSNLSALYNNQGKLADADHMYLRALEGYEKALGPDYILSYAPALNNASSFGMLSRSTLH